MSDETPEAPPAPVAHEPDDDGGMLREAIRFALVLAIVAAVGFGFAALQERKGYGLRAGGDAPAFTLTALDGRSVATGSLRGKWLLVNFWATWCPPCVQEMPSLERLHRALGNEGLVVLGVSTDEDEAALRAFVARHGVTFTMLRDPGGSVAAGAYHATGYPETFLIDPSGKLVRTFVGPAVWDTPESIGYFRGLLQGKTP